MADNTDRTLDFDAASLASSEYPESARNPTVARMARTVTTTMSSARVNPDHFLEAAFLRIFQTREETESVTVFRISVEKRGFMPDMGHEKKR